MIRHSSNVMTEGRGALSQAAAFDRNGSISRPVRGPTGGWNGAFLGRVERSRPGRSRVTARPRMQLRRLQPAAPAPSGRVAGWRRDWVRSGAGVCVQNGFDRNGPCYSGTPLEDRIDGFRESTSRWNGNVTAAAGRSGDAEVRALVTREVKASGVRFGRFPGPAILARPGLQRRAVVSPGPGVRPDPADLARSGVPGGRGTPALGALTSRVRFECGHEGSHREVPFTRVGAGGTVGAGAIRWFHRPAGPGGERGEAR